MSGGMSGVERAVYVRRFGEAEAILRRHGYGCINPCRVWACRFPWIYKAMEFCLGHSKAYALILAYDLLLLMTRADGIAMLPGWQASRGAQIELKKKQKELLQTYQNDKQFFHRKYRDEKHEICEKMHTLRLEYLTVNNIETKETKQADK